MKRIKHRVRIDDAFYPYSDAKQDVVLQRNMADVWKGQPGVPKKCMNAVCIVRNAKAFPHPVIAVSVIKSRAYVFDSPNHVYRYLLSKAASMDIATHDMLKIGQPTTLTLKAPRGRNAGGIAHHAVQVNRGRSGNPRGVRSRNHPLLRGEQGRIAAAVGAA
jgi:hypothetical protein